MVLRQILISLLFIGILCLAGCDPEAADTTGPGSAAVEVHEGDATVEIYKYDGSLKCVGNGTDLSTMAEELTENGIQVFGAYRDTDGYYHAETCGMPSGTINVYEISLSKVETALALGFMQLDILREDAGPATEI